MAAASRVPGQEDVAGADNERAALGGLELQRARKGNDKLPGQRIVG